MRRAIAWLLGLFKRKRKPGDGSVGKAFRARLRQEFEDTYGKVRPTQPKPKAGATRLAWHGAGGAFSFQLMGEDGKWRELAKDADGKKVWNEVEEKEPC